MCYNHTMRISGSQIIIALLRQRGIDHVSGIPGGSILPLYDELYSAGIRHILVRQEQAAGFIAQGEARTTGRAAVCLATSGPGAMNLLTAIADARCDSVPLVAITGQVNTDLIGTDAFQEADTFGLSFPISKHSMLIKSAEDLLTAVPAAFAIAETGRPGPVLIDVPRNIQMERIEIADDALDGLFGKVYARYAQKARDKCAAPSVRDEALRGFARALSDAERPVLFVGGGCNSPRASSAVRAFADAYPLPVVSSLMGLGVVPSTDALFMGMVGMHGSYCANRAMHGSDLVLAAGARFDDRATGLVSQFCPNAKVLHIDIDAAEVNKIIAAQASVVCDVADAFGGLLPLLHGMESDSRRSLWLSSMRELRAKETVNSVPGAFIASVPVLARKAGILPEDIIVTTDVGQHQMWTARHYPIDAPRQLLTSGSLGTMGFGLPAAIGAATANPQKRVVCFSGDGSILMNVQELATLAEEKLDVTVIVLENGVLGMVRQQQEFLFDRHYSASVFSARPDLLALARAFGIASVDADSDADWHMKAFAKGPVLVRKRVAMEENVLPFVPAGKPNIESIR